MFDIQYIHKYPGISPFAKEPILLALITPSDLISKEIYQRCLNLFAHYPEWLSDELSQHLTEMKDPPPLELSPQALLGKTIAQWTLAALNEVRGFIQAAGADVTPDGRIQVWLGFHHIQVSKTALELTLRALLLAGDSTEGISIQNKAIIDQQLNALWQDCKQCHPDYQARILMYAAQQLGIPFLPFIENSRFWQFGWGCNARVFMESASNKDGMLAAHWAGSKVSSKQIFVQLGMPTPQYLLVQHQEQLEEAALKVGWPCVIKPLNCGGGKGVSANIQNLATLKKGYHYARNFSSDSLMVERHIEGDDYRIMVIGGKVSAVIRRDPASITGDGIQTISQLIKQLNKNRTTNLVKSAYKRPIMIDDVLIAQLEQQDVSLNYVPATGVKISLRSNANISTGGSGTDVSTGVHPDLIKAAEAIATTMGLHTTGVDYITTDISRSWSEGAGAFIEVNTTPGLCVLISSGLDPLTVGAQVLGETIASVPICFVVVSPEELDIVMAILQQKSLSDDKGWSCKQKVSIGSLTLHTEGMSPQQATEVMLRHQSLHQAIVVYDTEQLMRYGAPISQCEQVLVSPMAVKVLSKPWIGMLKGLPSKNTLSTCGTEEICTQLTQYY